MRPIRMKKWKWASIIPPDRCTSDDEQNTSPAVTKKAATRRLGATRAHSSASVGVSISSARGPGSKPRHRPNAKSAGMCSPSTQHNRR
jgi:hypothetical protein